MTDEEKAILLKDLCGRLPYDVKVWVKTHHGQIIESDFLTLCNGVGYYSTLSYEGILDDSVVMPYLRPMDSMTEEEKDEWKWMNPTPDGSYPIGERLEMFDWLNKNMFDYRGLIPKGIALPASKDMYNKI